jgi:hypothetical protein
VQLKHLLWAEELQHEQDVRLYDMSDVLLEPLRGGLLSLQVRCSSAEP